MFFQTITTPGLSLNTYLLGSTKSKCCVVIDPCRQIAPYLAAAQNAGLKITHIIETHIHTDFISGAKELKHEMEETPLIYSSGMGGKEWIPSYADKIVSEGDIIQLDSIRLQALHTPGHTPEHLSWICYDEARNENSPWFAFTGDFLFVGGVGRPDLMGQEAGEYLANQLYESLFEKIQSFPDYMEIFPGHSNGSVCGNFYEGRSSSTLGFERLSNPYLKLLPKPEWTKRLVRDFKPYPSYLHTIKQMNVAGPALLETLKTIAFEGSVEEVDLETLFIVDTRSPQKFAEFHIKNSINIPLQDNFCHWCSWFVQTSGPIGLISDDHYRDSQLVTQLRLVGFDQTIVLIALSSRVKSHLTGESFKLLPPPAVDQNKMCIIDVRTLNEWQEGYIPKAQHLELIHLEQALNQFARDVPVVTVCRSGMRASIAASILQKNGFQNVASIQGGMQSWVAAGLPVEKS